MAGPSGIVTFLFTDIEGSTRLWQADEMAMRVALSRHDELLRRAVADHDGVVFSSMGDGVAAVFSSASAAVAAALTIQQLLEATSWPTATPIRVRMGIHTGEADARDGDYFGTAVNRTARLMAIGHGGQVLCSAATAEIVGDGVALVDLGEHRLRDLDRPMHVFQVGAGSFAALRSLDAFPGNLPRQVTSFVGRDREVAVIVDALSEGPVVTLTGVGGVGKTRLALQAAAEALPGFKDGAWLVELGSVRDGGQIVEAVIGAFALSVAPGAAPEDALVDFLRNKQLVLVVDNCEHLIGAAASLVSTVVAACARVAILATSREGLTVAGERMIVVPSLGAPSLDGPLDAMMVSEAVRLFVDRAVAVDSDFALDAGNAKAVAMLCRRLDGIPLAIELAAARVPTMTPAELVSRLDRRFRLLAGGRRGAVERHQTLWAAIDWSYDLLVEPERRLLARLSVFAGGCSLDAAEAICSGDPLDADDVFDLLAGLVARSLVVAVHDGPVTRYRLLETIRQYGEEHLDLDEADRLRVRHSEHFALMAEAYARSHWGPEELEWSRRLTADGDNLVAAMNWAVDTNNADVALRICTNLVYQVGYTVIIPTEPALGLSGVTEHRLYPVALAISAFYAGTTGDRRLVEERCAQAVDAERRLGDPDRSLVDAWVASAHGNLETTYGHFQAAASHNRRAAELHLSSGRIGGAALNLATASYWLVGTVDETDAVDVATEALTLANRSGAPVLISNSLQALANALADREPARARALLSESLERMDLIGYHDDSTQSTAAAIVAAHLGERRLTLQLARRAIPVLHWRGELPFLGGVLQLAASALALTRPASAAVLQGGARRIALAWAASQDPSQSTPSAASSTAGFLTHLRRQTTRRLAATLTQEQLTQLRTEGEAMDLDSAVSYALDEIDNTLADPGLGDN